MVLTVAYRASVGVATWRGRQATSPVPGSWPYGLDRLAEQLPDVRYQDVPPLSAGRARLAGLIPPRRRRPGGQGDETAIAWDELTAVDLVANLAPDRCYAGVIWATDAVAAGQRSRQLRLMQRVLRQLDGLWVLSRPQAAAVREWLGPTCPPVHFLRFGVDPGFYASADGDRSPHVVSVGGDRDRDPETLFAALELVRQRHPDVRITVQTKTAAPAPEGVRVVDRLPHIEVAGLLRTATVAAIATRPNLHVSGMTVGLEAQASGVPLVVSDTPGMRDYFVPDETARLVPPRDPDAMAEQIVRLLDDRGMAAAMGAAGRRHVLAQHSIETMCAELADIVRGRGRPV